MADKKVKYGFGLKDKMKQAVIDGKLNTYDMIVATDTDEAAYVDASGEVKLFEERLKEDIQFKGTSIGNWTDGSTAKEGLSFTEWLKQAAQKSIPATYVKPSVVIANNGGTNAGNIESGTSVTPKLRATFNKNDAGNLTAISIKKANASVKDGTTSPLDYNGEAIVVGDETITFTASASYGDGAIKNDNLGQPSPGGQIKAGTVNSNGYSFTGQRNLFYGTGIGTAPELTSDVIRNLQNKKLNPTQGYSFSMTVATGQQYVIIAYRDNIRDLNKVHYVEGNDPNLGKNFKKSTLQVADARGGENGLSGYKVFLLQLSTPGKAPMTLNVTI